MDNTNRPESDSKPNTPEKRNLFSTYEVVTRPARNGVCWEVRLHRSDGESFFLPLCRFSIVEHMNSGVEKREVCLGQTSSVPLNSTPDDLCLISEALLAAARIMRDCEKTLKVVSV